jgi:hypothetical protein
MQNQPILDKSLVKGSSFGREMFDPEGKIVCSSSKGFVRIKKTKKRKTVILFSLKEQSFLTGFRGLAENFF